MMKAARCAPLLHSLDPSSTIGFLHMGLVNSPAFAQSRMEEVLRGVEDTEIYIDNIGIFSNSWDDHLKRLDTALDKLQENNCIISPK